MQLLKHFHEISLHPKNARELKGLILQLAVQGKLTAQWRLENPDIEPAEKLLELIQKEKAQLVKEKKIKKVKPLPPITENEISYELPNGWIWVKFGSIMNKIIGGGTPSKRIPEYWGGNLPWASVKDLKQGKYLAKTVDFITEKGLNNSSSNLIPIDSLIICTRMGLGKICINQIPITINQDLKAVKLSSFISIDYVYNWYKTLIIKGSGMTVAGIKQEELLSFNIPLPSFNEQKAIVKIVEQLTKEVEQLEALTEERIQLKEKFSTSALKQLTINDTVKEWEYLKAHFSTFFNEEPNIKKLRETILQLAVQGKLTAHWRTSNPIVEPSEHLLKRIKAEKEQLVKEKKIKKEKPLPPITKEEIPYELPEGWVWLYSQDLFRFEQGIQVDKNLQLTNECDGYVRFLRIVDFTQKTDDIRYVKNPGEKYLISTESLVMVRYGASAGFIGSDLEGVLANNLFKIHYSVLIKDFVKLLFQSPYFMGELFLNAKGGAMPAINFGFLNKFKFPLAPLLEQKAIVEKVNSLMALCDSLEQEVKQSKVEVEMLMKGVLREVVT